MAATVYLIPTVLYEGQTEPLPAYLLPIIKQCTVFFVENERTARRYLKTLWKEMVIDDYEWNNMKEVNAETVLQFKNALNQDKTIGIISEAGCPGVADPGQILVDLAHQLNAVVKPLVGPSSILLALMASGMNGQQFEFVGYLPIDTADRIKAIKEMEINSQKKQSTQIFIETPYRNNQLIETLLKTCKPSTRICIAAELTGSNEFVKTKTINEWKKEKTDFHKKPVIFLLYAA